MTSINERDWYTVGELEVLAEVCRPTIYSWLRRKWLKHYMMGGRIRISKAEWQNFLTRE